MRYYELTYLLSPDLSEEEVRRWQEKIRTTIQEEGGIISETKNPLKRKLAYPIKDNLRSKKREGYLATLSFNLDSDRQKSRPEKLENLEKKLRAENQILRYLISSKRRAKIIAMAKKPFPKPKIPKKVEKPKVKKVELGEIEKKLEEILGE